MRAPGLRGPLRPLLSHLKLSPHGYRFTREFTNCLPTMHRASPTGVEQGTRLVQSGHPVDVPTDFSSNQQRSILYAHRMSNC